MRSKFLMSRVSRPIQGADRKENHEVEDSCEYSKLANTGCRSQGEP
jgi:hypothetical protein